jgi:Glyoxalase-like domain
MQSHLDHVIWACPDLDAGVHRFEALTGIRPRYGGAHASGLTHNALVSLGGRCYLEVLAPVGPESPKDDEWCRLARTAHEPRILTYCMRSARPLSELASIATASGWKNAVVAGNGRITPEGVSLRWQWLAPQVERFGLAFPFFIDWLDSPHPGESPGAAQAGAEILLDHFAVGHPDAAGLKHTLGEIGVNVDTYSAADVQFRLQLKTPRGTVSL